MAAGDPTGSPLATVTVSGNGWDTSFAEITFTFDSPYSVVSGTKYAIVISAPDADLTGNEVDWRLKDGDAYAGGAGYESADSGSTWSEDTGYDGWFKTLAAGPTEKDTNTFADATYFTTIQDVEWYGQTFTAGSNYDIIGVILKAQKLFALNVGNVTVSLYDTESDVSKATNPTPDNAATNVTLDQATLTWEDGGTSDSFDVYYGTESGDLTLVSSAQEGLSFTITGITDGSPYDYLVTRYWRVDSRVGVTTVTGDEWSFTTIRLLYPSVPYWYADGPFWYILLDPDADPPPDGVEDTDYEIVSFSANFIRTNRKLVAASGNAFYYEDI